LAVQEIVTAVQQCQFEFNTTDSGSLSEAGGPVILDHSLGSGLGSIASISSETSLLESVLIQIINTFLCCVKCDSGVLLSEDQILEIMRSILRIGRETRPSTDSLRKTAELALHEIVKIIFNRVKNSQILTVQKSGYLFSGEKIFGFICEMCDVNTNPSSTENMSTIKINSPTAASSTNVNSIGTRYLGIGLACCVIEIIGDNFNTSNNKPIRDMICNQLCRSLLRNATVSYQTILYMTNGDMLLNTPSHGQGSNTSLNASLLAAASGGNLQPTHTNFGNNLMLLSAVLKCMITYLSSLKSLRNYLHEQLAAVLLSLLQHLPPAQTSQHSGTKKTFNAVMLPFELQELILEYLVEICRDSNFIAFLYCHYDCYGCFDKKESTRLVYSANPNTVPNLFEHIYLYLNSYIGLSNTSGSSNKVTGNQFNTSSNNYAPGANIGVSSSPNYSNMGNIPNNNYNLHTLHILAWQGLLSIVRCLAERSQELQETNPKQVYDSNTINNMIAEIKSHKKHKHKMMEIVAVFNSSPIEGITQLLQMHNIVIPKDLMQYVENETTDDSSQSNLTVNWKEVISLLQKSAETITKFLLDFNIWLDKQKIVDYFNSFSSPANTPVDIKIKVSPNEKESTTDSSSTTEKLTHETYLVPLITKTKKDPLRNVLPLEVMRQFMDGFDFYGMRIDEALRYFISRCKISGEGQQVERIVKLLGDCYYRDNNTLFALERSSSTQSRVVPAVSYFTHTDQSWIMAVAIMMLHTDLHHHHNRSNRMNLDQFIVTIGYHDELRDVIPRTELEKIYNYVRDNEFEVVTGIIDSFKNDNTWREIIVDPSLKYFEQTFADRTEQSEKDILLSYVYDMDMFQSMWGHMIMATTIILENTEDILLLELAVRGFLDSARVAATHHLHHVFDNLVITLCKFTTLLDGVTPPSISVINCTTTSQGDSTYPVWPTNVNTTTTVIAHDGNVLSTSNNGSNLEKATNSPSSPIGMAPTNNTQFHQGDAKVMDKNRAITTFGHNEKAKLACRTVFAITRKYGDNLREGWKNILDLICRMRELELLPESLVDSRFLRQLREFQFPSSQNTSSEAKPQQEQDQSLSSLGSQVASQVSASGASLYGQIITSIAKSTSKKSKTKNQGSANGPMRSTTFSLLSTMFGGFYGSSEDSQSELKKKSDSDSDDESFDDERGSEVEEHYSIEIKHALEESRKCIEQCRIVELLMMDAKELNGNSLEYLLSALIRNGKPTGVLMSMHIPAPHLFVLKSTGNNESNLIGKQTTNTSTYYYYERDLDTSLFCLDLLCDILITNNLNRNNSLTIERLKLIWNYVYGHVYKLMISILQLYQPSSIVQSIYQTASSPNSAPPTLNSNQFKNPSPGTSSGRSSPVQQPQIRTRMTKQHYHILQRCITCIWRLCIELTTIPSPTSTSNDENQNEWRQIQKEMLLTLIDNLGKQWSETLLGVFHNSLLPMMHMFVVRHGDTILEPMGLKFIQERTSNSNTHVSNLVLESSQTIVDFWDQLVFKILRSVSVVSTSWINNNPSTTLFTSLKPSQQLQVVTRSMDLLTLTLQKNDSKYGPWFVVPDNVPSFVHSLLALLSASITTNVNNHSSTPPNQFITVLKKTMSLAMDTLSILETFVVEILNRIVSAAFSSIGSSQNIIKLDNKWINAWLSILDGIALLCCTGGINSTGNQSSNTLNTLMGQLNNQQNQMLSQLQKDIRTQALASLQRSLVYSCDFKYTSSLSQTSETTPSNLKHLLNDQLLMMCMERVLLKTFLQTLLSLKPKTTEYQSNHNTEMDLASLEELRVRANHLLARVFLHFLPRICATEQNQEQRENGFQNLWISILRVMYSFLLVKPRSDHLRESLPELLKNMILVMNNVEAFKLTPQLWDVTEKELSQCLPTLVDDVKPRIMATMTQQETQETPTNASSSSEISHTQTNTTPTDEKVSEKQ